MENIGFGSKMQKTSIFAQKRKTSILGKKKSKTFILGQKCRKHQFFVKKKAEKVYFWSIKSKNRFWVKKPNMQLLQLPSIKASVDLGPTPKDYKIRYWHSMILQHALQWPIRMLKFITMPKICVIKLGFLRISYPRLLFICTIMTMAFIKFSHTYIVKTLVLLMPDEVRVYDVDFGSTILKTTIFG